MVKANDESKNNLGESIRQQLKNLSKVRNRPFDEILRYYSMERFLYRLSISSYSKNFFLKGGLMLKVWDHLQHRATMDIDLLACTSNKIENLRKIITEIAAIQFDDDAILFDTEKLILRETQTGADYHGVGASFSAKLFTIRIPVLIDIGFNDIVIPKPKSINYPTLIQMPAPKLMGYTPETVFAEKLESIVKLGIINTRMKDFYDLWVICRKNELNHETLEKAILDVFTNRNTKIRYPTAFKEAFYKSPKTLNRWQNFLSGIGSDHLELRNIIYDLANFIGPLLVKLKKI
ncbi:MAG: nucleotidyl transferase AbiEii/AbiGii toxin family protein [Chlamydiae bacterium]|nr:nucleotidyl transferase AbiEii/AbiGii toxin family protein [Chlamydiota bacterium]